MRHENSSILELDGKEVSEFTPSKPREKWLRKRTHVKIRVGLKMNQVPEDYRIQLSSFPSLSGTFISQNDVLHHFLVFVFVVFILSGQKKPSARVFLTLLRQNVTANHRVSDAVFTEDSQQVVTGRFMYGPLDMVTLAGEKVISYFRLII